MGDITMVTPGFAILNIAGRYSNKKSKLKPGRRCVLPFSLEMGISSPGHVLLAYLRRLRTGRGDTALLFPYIDRRGVVHEGVPFTDADFIKNFKVYLSLAGMDDKRLRRVSNHSFRSGGASDWSIGGMPADFIKRQGGWTSDCYKLYVRPTALHAFTAAVHMAAAAQKLFISVGLLRPPRPLRRHNPKS